MIIRTKNSDNHIFTYIYIPYSPLCYFVPLDAIGLSPSCQSLPMSARRCFCSILAAAQAIADQIFAALLLPQLLILVPATA